MVVGVMLCCLLLFLGYVPEFCSWFAVLWEHFLQLDRLPLAEQPDWDLVVSIAVVTGLVPSIVCSLLTSIIYSGLTYILMVGGIRVYLKLCAGEKAEIGDLFSGFQNDPIRFGGIGALISAVMELCLLPVVILVVAMSVEQGEWFPCSLL